MNKLLIHFFFTEAERQTENKVVDNQANRVCYYALPHVNTTVANLSPRNIPPDLCTHIIIIGANIQNNKIVPVEENDLKVSYDICFSKTNINLRELTKKRDGGKK